MFNLSGSEIIVILLLALVVLGPEKLPDALRRAGRTYAELKKMGNSFQTEMRSVIDEPMKEMRETADMLRSSATFDDTDPKKPGSGGRAVPSSSPAQPVAAPTVAPAPAVEPAPPIDAPVVEPAPADDASPPTELTDVAATNGAAADEAQINRTLSGGVDPPAGHIAE
ncbi:MAG: twin-arginine translocase TatA/TatE family subunit [Ilumatobacteraceae bacterium]